MRRLGLAGLAVASLSLGGCFVSKSGPAIVGSGQTISKEYSLADFSKVAAGSTFQVEITQGDGYRVTLIIDDNLPDYLSVSRSGDTLRIFTQPNVSLRNATLKARVVMPSLAGLDLSGATRTTVSGFASDNPLAIRVSGASNLRGEIKNGEADVSASGASHLELRGSAARLKVHVSGASHVNLEGYGSGDTSARAEGASHLTVNPSGHLTANASGASSVRYAGRPASVQANASGASSVKPK
jgi:hypothetical protein